MSLQDTSTAARVAREVHRQIDGRMASLRVVAGLCFPTVKTLRETADLLSDMADLAADAMRAIHDAIPDQITPAPGPDAIRPDCPVCNGTGAEDWAYLGYFPCRQCLPHEPWPGERR